MDLDAVQGILPVGEWFRVEEADHDMGTSMCLSRVRPDQVSGVLDLVLYAGDGPYALRHYDRMTIRMPFTISYGAHNAFYYGGKYDCDTRWDSDLGVWYYDVLYDDAWPWDTITDPAVRDLLYEAYTPCNTPP